MSELDVKILTDTTPFRYSGEVFGMFGTGYAFTFDLDYNRALYFQAQPFLKVFKANTREELYEFRIVVNQKISKKIEEEGFYEEAYKLLLSAIDEFNNRLKVNISILTAYKSYIPVQTLEQAKDYIRQAYLVLNFDQQNR